MTRLFFCQNGIHTPREGGSFWQKDSFVTLILFELHMPLMIFSPVTNFGDHPLIQYDNEIYLCLTVFAGFLMLSPMMHGRKIPGIIKKINKALGKFIYPKYLKHSNECYNLAVFWTIRPSGQF